ncbi:TonB-dependent receptor [Massilibacteroides sp.]|uniref:TonB-dependent receptor n=1 Tax=Massilibacteroides sp. TaxID=2034766 RepID=UPI002637A678|nr:TonB-dependent receptor [Massilibacteroides sp.]MDD4516307.1 TonB-dependent receptor [Massilibacteroides sp.]
MKNNNILRNRSGNKHISFLMIISFLFLSSISLHAEKHDSVMKKEQSFTMKMENQTVKEFINYIEKNSEYIFSYTKNVLGQLEKRVSVRVENKEISDIMEILSKEAGLNYEIKGRQVILSNKTEAPQQVKKGVNVNGTVWDEQGEPLIGVNVSIKSTSTGTTTDINGNYFLSVPDKNAELVFSYIGYQPTTIKVGNQININVNMKEISTGLNEVVVVGFGSQKRESVVGSITTIEPNLLQQSPTRALSNNLAGQVAGVIAVQRSGEPGSDGSSFWIRGISSFQNAGRSPLVLVDGIERTLDDMDPAEIESFSVLKDAAASAVYGVRGANGVILVNTKRGKLGKPSINVHYEQGFTQPVKLPNFIGSADYLSLMNELSTDGGGLEIYSPDIIEKYRTGEDTELYPDVDWLDTITKDHASNRRANLTVTGGSDILRYALVASYYGESGIFERDKSQTWDSSTKLNKYNMRSNVDVNITKTTIARVSVGGYLQDTNGMTSSSDDVLGAAFETPPFVHPTIYSTGEIPRVKSRQNPWAKATQHGFQTYTNAKIESLFSLEQDLKFLLPGLKIKGLFSFDRYMVSGILRSKSPDYYNPASSRDEDGNLELSIADYGQMFLNTEQKKEWGNRATYIEGSVNYNQHFGKHNVEGMFLYNQRDYQNGSVVPYRRMGIAGRASYNYDNRYIAEFNFGYNGSENFAKGYRFGFFPSFALGYLLSEEAFMENYKETISKLKLRGSWGLVGNDQLAGRRFAYITTINSSDDYQYKWGVNNDYHRTGRFEGDFGIPNLTWETVAKTNIGFELGLWNALDLQVDWFKEKREDIFMKRNTIPSAAGFINTPWANYGKVDNQGVDISLVYNKQINNDWFVGFRGTMTYAKNKIIEQDEAPGVMGTNRQRTGLPVNQLFGLVADGLFTEDDFIDVENGILKDGIPDHTFVSKIRPGDIKYVDIDGDGAVTDMDEVALKGTTDPQLVYGLGGNIKYKNFDMNIFFQGIGKTYRFIGGTGFMPGSSMGAMYNIFDNYQDRWTPENPSQDVFYPRLTYGQNENNSKNSTWWLRDMSMLRMKDLEVGYSFSKSCLVPMGVKSLRLYLKGTNLLTFSKFKMWDPELATSNGMKYPIMKSVSFGLDINF